MMVCRRMGFLYTISGVHGVPFWEHYILCLDYQEASITPRRIDYASEKMAKTTTWIPDDTDEIRRLGSRQIDTLTQ